jgi:N-acetylmuramoyl-L-alanine amidase
MRVENIPNHENEFDEHGLDIDGKIFHLTPSSIAIPNEDSEMAYVLTKSANGDTSFYHREAQQKDQIVLHYTMGYLRGDIAQLTRNNMHVSVPFVIGCNGKIYNLFSSKYWSYHLGPGSVGGNKVRSQKTIGIELCNIGPLTNRGDALSTSYSSTDKYCDLAQTEHYQSASYRDFDYYSTFADAQYEALIVLVRYLTARYDIKRKFLPESERFETRDSVPSFGGIVSHVNYRATGKTDIGPAFDWQRLIDGVIL